MAWDVDQTQDEANLNTNNEDVGGRMMTPEENKDDDNNRGPHTLPSPCAVAMMCDSVLSGRAWDRIRCRPPGSVRRQSPYRTRCRTTAFDALPMGQISYAMYVGACISMYL